LKTEDQIRARIEKIHDDIEKDTQSKFYPYLKDGHSVYYSWIHALKWVLREGESE